MKPVLFIPGFPASELHDARTGATVYPPSLTTLLDPAKKQRFLDAVVDVPGGLIAGPPIATVAGIAREAQSLYDILAHQFGYETSGLKPAEFAPIGWDWRESISSAETMASIRDVLDFVSPEKAGNVLAIVHSTGGLVFRAFLEQQPEYRKCFEQVLAFGVPWRGALEALYAVTQGESEKFLFLQLLSAGQAAWMISHAQAAYDLIPRAWLANQSWITKPYMRALAATAHAPFAQQFDDLPVTNVCAWGAPTWSSCSLVNGGLEFSPQDKDAGDGTVTIASSSWLQGAQVRSLVLPIGAYATGFIPKLHAQLWDSPPLLQIFDEIIADAPRQPFVAAAADSDEVLDYHSNVTIRVAAMAADGSPLPDCVASLDGKAELEFNGTTRGSIILRRAGVHHNIEPDLYRFTIDFRWDGGSAERAVVIRSV